jgi:hypothetical protein
MISAGHRGHLSGLAESIRPVAYGHSAGVEKPLVAVDDSRPRGLSYGI